MSETLFLAAAIIVPLVLAIVFHEVAHGYVARMLGDETAHRAGRLTLNPVRHVDPVGTILVPGALALLSMPVFGWAKPVPVRKDRLRNPRFGMMAVAFAGPGTNLVLALVGAIGLGLLALATGSAEPGAVTVFLATSLNYFILINIFLALFNLLPIPPFDGSHILEGVLPRRLVPAYERLRPLGFALVFVLLLGVPYFLPGLGIVENVIVPPVEWLRERYMAVAIALSGA
ncbi:site-2 protease family protein [Croceicoccus sp. F390]|uniref:Site-2 protease family protein n=1 Tax=Croceicoccus esteveae TaxID=3075597 RepID=A0ABU2ZJV2_9SPHN|nr:site-2 protease family protein [Croceicoccus sp. F390]MDT0576880.1 site-2 protease family protein [Croceicoccus sp. F390]